MVNLNKKKGSVEIVLICFMVTFFIFIYFFLYLLYSKININIYTVKHDLYNIAQNAVLAFDKDELAYNNYKINNELLYQKINNLIELSYDNVSLNYVVYDKNSNKVNISVEIDLNLENWMIKDKVIINESIKLNMMEIENEIK